MHRQLLRAVQAQPQQRCISNLARKYWGYDKLLNKCLGCIIIETSDLNTRAEPSTFTGPLYQHLLPAGYSTMRLLVCTGNNLLGPTLCTIHALLITVSPVKGVSVQPNSKVVTEAPPPRDLPVLVHLRNCSPCARAA